MRSLPDRDSNAESIPESAGKGGGTGDREAAEINRQASACTCRTEGDRLSTKVVHRLLITRFTGSDQTVPDKP
ncbi:hypothetical protein Stube_38610 [Streptomyces tubercidicus]|uniref:Uncharacterized protein n=1 Tax=Streptomyces tubercidicus TaxID=47759 RepID=A0A640USS0_9ACTN|nr:hypothetical protein Stube_38610 [Streptomyces tubercidicus]